LPDAFWSKVTPEPADLAVLSLLGPQLSERAVLDALGLDAVPDAMTAAPLTGGGFVRRMSEARPGQIELDVLVDRGESAELRRRLTGAGVHPAGVWAYEAHRVAAVRPRLGVDTDERAIPHEVGWIGGPGLGAVHLDKGCYRGQETVARVHNLGKPPRMLALLHLDGSVDRPATGELPTIPGRVPPLGERGTGCPFRDRCPRSTEQCAQLPPLAPITEGGSEVACWHPEQAGAMTDEVKTTP